MPDLIKKPTQIKAAGPANGGAGNKPKIIKELIGLVNSKTREVSIAHMHSPCGWKEPGQIPEFNEYTYVLKGVLQVDSKRRSLKVKAGQAIIVKKGQWVRYSSPHTSGAEYIAVCLPAFSPKTVHRDH